jgi:ABC-2 type transport system permease protein
MNASFLFVRRIRAFIARDFRLAVSYKVDLFLRMLSILVMVTTLFFISKIFSGQVTAFPQWRDPFATWITGLPVINYFMTGFSSLANAIREEQKQGTLESLLLTPLNIPTIIVASSAWDLVQATFYSSLYFVFGWLFFGVSFRGNIPLALLFLILTTLVLACFGILSASFAMVFKRGDPFAIILGTGSALFSGVLFPTQLLGKDFGIVSKILPATYGLDGIRRVLILGESFSQVQGPLSVLLIFLLILLPFSVWVFERAVRRAKREGSLIQF